MCLNICLYFLLLSWIQYSAILDDDDDDDDEVWDIYISLRIKCLDLNWL